jgi:hypothetical protein
MHKSAPGVGAQEHIVRPQPVNLRSKRSPRRFVEGVAEAKEVPVDVSEIRIIVTEVERKNRCGYGMS